MRIATPLGQAFAAFRRTMHRWRLARAPTRLELVGLRGPVQVLTSRYGVPHIHAEHAADLFFAQGYITARDRLFQMDYNRHGARGRISELVGRRAIPWKSLTVHLKERTTFDVDLLMRSFGLEEAGRQSLNELSREGREVVAAYTAGVNAYLATLPMSLEHRLIDRPPQPWSELDSVVLVKAIGFELNYAWRAVLFGALLEDGKVPEAIARALWPRYPATGPSIVDASAMAAMAKDFLATGAAAAQVTGMGQRHGVGSNCFAVAAEHTEEGEALLANDTHLAMLQPTPWHEVRLSGGGFDLHGFTLAGVPGIGIGRSPHLSWGITAGLVHDADLFVEKVDPSDANRYLTPTGSEPFVERNEIFHVRGEGPVARTLLKTRHGPVLDSVSTLPPSGYRYALAWTGHHGGRELDALLGLWKARKLEDASAALAAHVCPTFNMTFADPEGRLYYLLAGAIPKRKKDTPLRPLEGWTGEWDWQGLVPMRDNPRDLSGKAPFIVTANNRVAPADYPHELGGLFEPADRFNRLTGLLGDKIRRGEKVSFADLAAMQLDTHAAWGLSSRAALLGAVGGIDGLRLEPQSTARVAAEVWQSWDGDAAVHSAGAAVAYAVAHLFGDEVVRRLAGDDVARAFLELGSFIGPSVDALAGPALRAELEAAGVDIPAVIREAFGRAVEFLRRTLGDDPTMWRWGDVHPLRAKHRFDGTPLTPLLSLGPEPHGGGPDTVCRGDMNAKNDFTMKLGAAMRMVVSAKNRDRAGTVVPGGNSGRPFSPHYDDQLALYVAGELKAAPVSSQAVEVEATEWLVPPGAKTPASTEQHHSHEQSEPAGH